MMIRAEINEIQNKKPIENINKRVEFFKTKIGKSLARLEKREDN